MFELKNKVALVTGAASGIGLCYSKQFLQKGLKAVALVDINEENGKKIVKELIAEFKTKDCAIFIKADVSNETQLEDAFEITVRTYNQLDIVINNAGILQEIKWEKCVAVNLNAVISGCRLAMDTYFPKYKSGSETLIVNTASIAAIYPSACSPVYVATKAGVIGFTRALGDSTCYKISNTRIIAICPGPIRSEFLNYTEDQIAEPYFSMLQSITKTLTAQRPEELVESALNIIPSAPSGSVWTITKEGCKMLDDPNDNRFNFKTDK